MTRAARKENSASAVAKEPPIARVRRLVISSPSLGDDGRWLADRLASYLNSRGGLTLDEALGIAVTQGGEAWWTREARERRDAAYRDLARMMVGASVAMICRAVTLYGETRWRRDKALTAMPANYSDTRRAALFAIYREGDGRIPASPKQIMRILGRETSRCHVHEPTPECEALEEERTA